MLQHPTRHLLLTVSLAASLAVWSCGGVERSEPSAETAAVRTATWGQVQLFIEMHPEFGNVGSTGHATYDPGRTMSFSVERGDPPVQLGLACTFMPSLSTPAADCYRARWEYPVDGGTGSQERDVLYLGEEIELWRDDEWRIGIRPRPTEPAPEGEDAPANR